MRKSFLADVMMANYKNQKYYKKFSIILIILAALLRLALSLSHTVSGDACWHLASARFIATQNKLPFLEGLGRSQPFWQPPAFHLAAALVYKSLHSISGELADLGLKLVSPFFGTLAVIIAYLLTKKLFDEEIAFYSMVFLNLVPLFLDYGIFSYTDSTTAFFSVLAVYFILKRRYVFSSVSFGIAILSKYNAVFMLPGLVYLAYKFSKSKKEGYYNSLIIACLSLLISAIWFLRNFFVLGNPFWPYLNNIFHGVNIGTSFNAVSFKPIFELSTYLRSYLEFFGVPNGNVSLIFFYNIPYIKYLIFIWAAGTLIFLAPFIREFWKYAISKILSERFWNDSEKKKESKENKFFLKCINILLLSHLLMLFVYLLNTGWFGARLLLPIVPFIAIIWARGMNSIKAKKAYLFLALIIGMGFVMVEIAKISIAAKEWSIYKNDFGWAKENSNEKSIFYGNGQCLSYNINRLVIDHTLPLELDKADFVWVNNKWRIDFRMNNESFNNINNLKNNGRLKIVYDNEESGTRIYGVGK